MPRLDGNWIDLLIIAILVYYGLEAFRFGFWGLIIDFVSLLGSFLISLRVYKFTADLLTANFNLSPSFANALGFIITAVIIEIALSSLFRYLVAILPKKVRDHKLHKLLGLIPALGEALILVAFFLTVIISLPVQPQIKKAAIESKIGGYILEKTSGMEKSINEIFGGAVNDALTYFTIEPKSNETIELHSGIDNLTYDPVSEAKMLEDVNRERTSRGLQALVLDKEMTGVAEAYAKDMWERRYFSHYNPEGESVGDRLTKAGISYFIAGENLALAPTEQTAMSGLMNSSGHRANILSEDFKRVGIGVVDNGIYGKIFVQEFAD